MGSSSISSLREEIAKTVGLSGVNPLSTIAEVLFFLGIGSGIFSRLLAYEGAAGTVGGIGSYFVLYDWDSAIIVSPRMSGDTLV